MTSEESAQDAGDRIYSGQCPGDMGSNWCWGKPANFSPPLSCGIPCLRVPTPSTEAVASGKSGGFILLAFLSRHSIASLRTGIRPSMKHRTGWVHTSLLLSAKGAMRTRPYTVSLGSGNSYSLQCSSYVKYLGRDFCIQFVHYA